jgi:hypothetical protein
VAIGISQVTAAGLMPNEQKRKNSSHSVVKYLIKKYCRPVYIFMAVDVIKKRILCYYDTFSDIDNQCNPCAAFTPCYCMK